MRNSITTALTTVFILACIATAGATTFPSVDVETNGETAPVEVSAEAIEMGDFDYVAQSTTFRGPRYRPPNFRVPRFATTRFRVKRFDRLRLNRPQPSRVIFQQRQFFQPPFQQQPFRVPNFRPLQFQLNSSGHQNGSSAPTNY